MKQDASLDTSFWSVGAIGHVLQYTFEFFEVYVSEAVRTEILAPNPRFPGVVYPEAQLFKVFEEDGRFRRGNPDPANVLPVFGGGEAQAIGFAQEQGIWVLINDERPRQHALRLGLTAIAVPEFVALLYDQGFIHLVSARRIMDAIRPKTSARIMAEVETALRLLADAKGETYP
jgi:predicted nucleic acid-binding protein